MGPAELVVAFGASREVAPRFLTEMDYPWLTRLIETHDRFVGRRWAELADHLHWIRRRADDPVKRQLAIATLAPLYRARPALTLPSCRARALVFGAAARAREPAEVVLRKCAVKLGVGVGDLESLLFADLERERVVTPPATPLSAHTLALAANLELAQRLLMRASAVTIEIEGEARRVVRHAHLRGLICNASRSTESANDCARLEVSGPYALFRHTRIYGHALAGLLPLLAWCRRFRLSARGVFTERGPGDEREAHLLLRTGDPFLPADPPRPFDSKLEERFARDFGKLAPEWEVIREPEAVAAGRHLVFPDFALVHRADPARRWLLEIAGFWTEDYVRSKLARYRELRVRNLILCLDARRQCDERELPPQATVLSFRGRVDARAVLALVSAVGASRGPDTPEGAGARLEP